ncbi:DEAD/DEAH box helicase [Rheinheimera sp.]|uniref:DEAD/DEAH box helicase n=1 Tax=Rheinheimera sp. TaxID=1869214 RepID=UPI00307E0ACE
MAFQDFRLDPRLVRSVQHLGFAQPTTVQQEAIPAAMTGKDLLVSSQTGSGKTLAYLLPMMQRLLRSKALAKQDARALILVPTRELAHQVYGRLRLFVANTPLSSALIVGGENFNDQEKLLKRQPQIIVATPGRLVDHLEHKSLFIAGLELLILDEADRMLDLGFMPQLTAINKAADHRLRQTLMFSATLDNTEINELAMALLKSPHRVSVGVSHQQHEDIEQRCFFADHLTHKEALLKHFISTEEIKQLILFTATREDTERLALLCEQLGLPAVGLSGKLSQARRNQVMQEFASGRFKVLVTTDVASRGLDLLQVSHVVNFDLPKHAEEYVHRIGRTGRAGQKGVAISLVGPKDWKSFCEIESFLRRPLPLSEVEGLIARFKGPVTMAVPKKAVKAKSGSVAKAPGQKPKQVQKGKKAASSQFFQAGDDGLMPVRKKNN